jgi:hypothetical protein
VAGRTMEGSCFWRRETQSLATESILHKEWCNLILISHSLETVPVFRATIKPASQCRFFLTEDRTLVAWSFLFAMEYSSWRGDLQ